MLALLLSVLLAFGAEGEDPLDLVGLLVRDAAWDKARAAIDAAEPGVDPVRYHVLRGTILAGQEVWDEAATAFSAAIAASDAAEQTVDPALFLQLARAELRAGDFEAAFQALEEGGSRSDRIEFPRQQVLLLVELGLYREAGERGAALLSRDDASPDDVLTIAESLRRGGAPAEADLVLTQGMLRFPAEVELRVLSGAVSMTRGRIREAANQLSLAAAVDPEYADEAAELYRKAGDLEAALRWNGAVVDGTAKARQRVGLLIEAERWDQVLALEDRLDRLDLLVDPAVAYGLAYARFQVRDLDLAEVHLRRITDPQVFALANELRAAMSACREDPWSCP